MQQIIDAFEKHPRMSYVLRLTVQQNGYFAGAPLCIPNEWGMRAAEKSDLVDAMCELKLATRKWELTEAGLSLACRLTS